VQGAGQVPVADEWPAVAQNVPGAGFEKRDCFFTNEASMSMKTKDGSCKIDEKRTAFCTK
jgi:hypothetical protein